jgi:hypothetical protein
LLHQSSLYSFLFIKQVLFSKSNCVHYLLKNKHQIYWQINFFLQNKLNYLMIVSIALLLLKQKEELIKKKDKMIKLLLSTNSFDRQQISVLKNVPGLICTANRKSNWDFFSWYKAIICFTLLLMNGWQLSPLSKGKKMINCLLSNFIVPNECKLFNFLTSHCFRRVRLIFGKLKLRFI